MSIGYAVLEVIPSARGFSKELDTQISGDIVSSGDKAGRSLGGSMLGGLGKGVAIAGGIGAALFGGSILEGGINRLSTIQDATASLTVIMKDAGKAGLLLDEIKKTVQGTPFSLEEFATAGKNLVAMGVAAEKVPGYLTSIGEAAAASGKGSEGVSSITDAFGKMAATGKVSLDQVNTIAYAGVPALQILANGFGVTTQEMSKMISKGAVPAGEAMDYLSKGIVEGSDGVAGATASYAGTMSSLRETLRGATGGLKSAGDRLGAALIGPFVPMATAGINKLTEFTDLASAKVGPMAQRVADEMTKVGSAFASSGASIEGQGTMFERAAVRARTFTDGVRGLFSLVTSGDFLGAKMTFGLEEDSKVVENLLKIRETAIGAYDILFKGDYTNPIWGGLKDSKAVDVLFRIRETAIGAYDILFKGDYTNPIWGGLKDSKAVDVLFRIRDGALAFKASVGNLFSDPSTENLGKSLQTVGAAGGGAAAVLSNIGSVAGPVSNVVTKLADAGVGLGATMLDLAGDSTVVLTAAVRSLGAGMSFLADNTGLVGVALGVTAVSMVAAQAVETGYHAARIATAIMMPAQLLIQRRLTAAIVEHTRALGAHVGVDNSAIATTLRGRTAQVARTAATRVATAATVQATSALGAYAAAQRTAAASSGLFIGGMRQTAAGAATAAGAVGGIGAAAAGKMRSGLSSAMGLVGGPWGVAILAATGLALGFASAHNKTANGVEAANAALASSAARFDEYRTSVTEALNKSGGASDGSVRAAVSAQVEGIESDLRAAGERAPSMWGKLVAGAETLGSFGASDAVNSATRLAISGEQADAALGVLDKLKISQSDVTRAVSGSSTEFFGFIRTLEGAGGGAAGLSQKYRDMRTTFIDAQSSASRVGDALTEINAGAVTAAGGVDGLTNALRHLRDDSLTAEDAQAKTTLALAAFSEAAATAGGDAFDAAGRIDTTTSAGASLHSQMLAVSDAFLQSGAAAYQSAYDTTNNVEQAAAAAEAAGNRIREDFIAQRIAAGDTREEAAALADQYRLFPSEIPTSIKLESQQARTDAENFYKEQEGRQVNWFVRLANNTLDPNAPVGRSISDTNVATPFFNPVPTRRDGGRISGPGTGRSDSILGMDRKSRVPTAWVSNRETIVNESASDKYEGEIAAMNRGLFPKLDGFAEGGRVGGDGAAMPAWYAAIDRFFSPLVGNEYLWGGTGPARFDCSGAVGKAHSLATGGAEGFTGRIGTTHTLLGGSWPGVQPGASASDVFVIGTSADHMAATIMGRNLESGGNDLRWGAGALGAFDASLPSRYRVDPATLMGGTAAGAMMGPGSVSSWSEKDELNLESARIAIDQATEARAKMDAADSKSSDSDRRQADIRIEKALARVAELEEKKATGAAGPAPDAPELVGEYSDERIEARSLELAVERARKARNEVYADPTKDASDREDADLALARARNARTKGASSGSSSGSGNGGRLMTFTELGGELGKIAAGGILETLGLQNSTLADPNGFLGAESGSNVRTSGAAPSKSSPLPTITIGQEEAMTQNPFTADPTKGIEQFLPWMKDVKSAALFDGGGMLEEGMLGLHMRKEPDAVLTNAETREWKNGNEYVRQLVSALSSSAGGSPERSGDTHYWEVHGPDERTVAARIAAKFDARMPTSLGRYRAP
ncbi:MAG: tape measure protein [Rhodococcus sp. (in: high G+C Gram-positive bacteria)]